MGPVALTNLSICPFVVAIVWFYSDSRKTAQEYSSLDQTVRLTCAPSQLPTIVPANGFWKSQLYHPGVIAGGAFTFDTKQPGTPLDTHKDDVNRAWRRLVSNFGEHAIADIEIEIPVHFRQALKTEHSSSFGDVVHSGKVPLTQRINLSSRTGTFEFYVVNYLPQYYA